MKRTDAAAATALTLLGILVSVSACSSSNGGSSKRSASESPPTCSNGVRDDDEADIDCGGSCLTQCTSGRTTRVTSHESGGPMATNGVQDGDESDVDCGGTSGVQCTEGRTCTTDADCEVACNYDHRCVSAPSCKTHLGGDTCGLGEVGPGSQHESCCRSLEVTGYTDPAHPGKKVYLDKYEITAGRVRAFVEQLAAHYDGRPNVNAWIATHRPQIWDDAWNDFLPTDYEGPTKVIARRLLGDPRVEDGIGEAGPGVILPPQADQPRNLGINHQFNSDLYVDLHGNNCGTFPDSYGFPTFWYPADILARDGQLPRADGTGFSGEKIAAKDLLDVKSMNCISNAMLAAFCAWDGGQLATDEVLDYVTATPPSLGNVSGCGTQYDDHGELLDNRFDNTVQSGGRCAAVGLVNATFDAGDALPVPNSALNDHNYHFPDLGAATHDKAWQIAPPGRASLAPAANGGPTDLVRIRPNDEPWADLNGNLNEVALDMASETFTGNFALKFRGVGYGSSRSILNVTPMKGEERLRIQRPEAKAAYSGGRCMRFR